MKGTLDQLISITTGRVKIDGVDTALLGPIVLDEKDRPYFVLVTGASQGAAHLDQIRVHSRSDAETLRTAMMIALVPNAAHWFCTIPTTSFEWRGWEKPSGQYDSGLSARPWNESGLRRRRIFIIEFTKEKADDAAGDAWLKTARSN